MKTGIIIGLLALLFVAASVSVDIYTDWLWFDSLGQLSVYQTVLVAKVVLFTLGTLFFFFALMVNYALARRLGPRRPPAFVFEEGGPEGSFWQQLARYEPGVLDRLMLAAALVAAIFFGLLFGASLAGQWETVLRFQNATSFGLGDPIFGQDIGFYVFALPLYRFLLSWLLAAVFLVGAAVAVVYAFSILGFNLSLLRFEFGISRPVKAHLAVLIAILLVLIAANYRLDIYDLLYSPRGVVVGATYADINAQLPALWLLVVVALLCAVLVLANVVRLSLRLLAVAGGAWLVVVVLGQGIYPALVQQFEVLPNELAKETPYIEHNIKYTRQAYALDRVEEKTFPAEAEVTAAEVRANPQTVNNIRLWDHRPLLATYNQIQAIRLYYDFADVDIDRYTIDGQYRQVMLSARELSPDKLPPQAQTWVNRRLQFTHGYGVVMGPVNEVTREGLPLLLVKDVPPIGQLPIERPEIYFGEKTTDYVIVNTTEPEFDYPKGEENVLTKYGGRDGVRFTSYLRRLAYAFFFGDVNILISGSITPESRILYRRPIQERLKTVAPFLLYDRDPYIVVADGRLYWIQDAYTYTNRYPYATPYKKRFNYLRNSVKAVVDAYDGAISFYVAEPSDPIINTYTTIFPTLFTPLDQMPASLRDHIRYPEGLFQAQAEMQLTYHMQDPRVFYNREDLWEIPKEVYEDKPIVVEPYYVIMRIPGELKEEFMLIQPFNPTGKDNMNAWLAARSDGAHYGKLLLFRYPKDRLIYGPMQVESRITQDPTISAQLTLWQRESRVIRGNLLVIPVGQSNLYVEPLYLQSPQSRIPELKRVIMATGDRIVMEPSISEAVARLFEVRLPALAAAPPPPTVTVPAPPPPVGPVAPLGMAELARLVQKHYAAAQERLKAGDWAGYGENLKAMEEALRRLVELTEAQRR